MEILYFLKNFINFSYFKSKSLWIFLAISRSSANGDTKLHIATTPLSANNFATSATRRIFSSRSDGEKPKFLFNPVRILSPSKPYAGIPRDTKYASSSNAIDVLPAPLRPFLLVCFICF